MKRILVICAIVFLAGCGPHPAPEKAVERCLEKGWKPYYFSSVAVTKFKCLPPDDYSLAPFDYRKHMYDQSDKPNKSLDNGGSIFHK